MPDELLDAESNFARVAEELFGAGTVQGTLQRIVGLAASTVDGCDAAGIMIVDEETPSTAAASSELVRHLDQAQIELEEGPCLDAAMVGTSFYAADLIDDNRWPAFAAVALEAGIRTVLAYSLSAKTLSALNLYGHLPAAFGATDRAQGQLFATLARLAIDSAEERAAGELRADNLTDALKTREVIGQAQGILMEREQISAEQAFDILRRASQRMNVKLRDIARDVIDNVPSSEQPEPDPT